MGGVWIITDTEKKFEVCNELHHKKWEDNTSGVAEVIVLLELITVLERRGRRITNGKIRIGFNNKNHHRNIFDGIKKSNVHAQEAGTEISMIKKMLSATQFEV